MIKRPKILQSGNSVHARDQAFSLIELVVALSISAMLLITIGGAVTIASKSLPGKDDVNRQHSEATSAAATMASDLRYAISFSELTPTAITFTVADRDDDGQNETIRYECTGTANSPKPLIRTVNGNLGTVMEDVRGFNLDYGTYTMTEPGPLVLGETAEQLLIDEGDTSGTSNFTIFVDDRVGERFKLPLSGGELSWRITRAKLIIQKQGGSDGVVCIQLRTVDDNGLPTAVVLDQVSFNESDGSAALSEVSFTGDVELSADADYCLVVCYESGSSAVGKVAVRSISSGSPNTALLEALFGEVNWLEQTNGDMVLQLFGHVTGFTNSPATVSTTRLRWVGIAIEPDEAAQSHVKVQTQILAKPEVAP